MLLLILPSVAYSAYFRVSLLLLLISVFFRVIPWQMLLFVLISVAYSASAYFRGK